MKNIKKVENTENIDNQENRENQKIKQQDVYAMLGKYHLETQK